MSELTLANIGLSVTCSASTFIALNLAKWQLSNIYNGDTDGQGPYDSIKKRVGQAALGVICTVTTVIALKSWSEMMKVEQTELEGYSEPSNKEKLTEMVYSLALQVLPPLVNAKNAKFAFTSIIAAIGGTSSLSNIITGDKAFGKPYGTFPKRLLNATMISITTLALINLYKMEPESCQAALAIGFSGVKVIASAALSATVTTASCIGTVIGGAWSVAKYASSFF